ncbi:MAG: cation:proton antiporter [Micavibrio aeruginosavorus]|nr:cation:proton antiporter [Micavibrio aeruginosavorus]
MHDITALTQMAFILAAAFSGGLLLQRLRQPALVGYILVGILLGPHALGLIHEGEEIRLLSELGILLLLFIVGLELDLRKFLPLYKIAMGTAALQITFSLLAMFGVSLLFGWPLKMVVLLGFAFSLSSTAVAIRLMEDLKALNTPVGNVAVGILIAQDLAVVPMILIISAFGADDGNIALRMLLPVFLVMATGALIWLMVARPAWLNRFAGSIGRIKNYLDKDRQRPLTALMFCFAAAAISGGLGFSAAYGAFIAGLVLGNTQYGHAYERQVRPLFDILMMFFFLSVGMLIDFHYLAENIWAVLLLVFVVMLLKTVINFGILRLYRLSVRHSIFIGATLGQVGEFSFAMASLGLSVGAINNDDYKLVIVIVALSLIMTPAWLVIMRRLRLIMRQLNTKKSPLLAGARQ